MKKGTRVQTAPGWISRWLPLSADPVKVREFATRLGDEFDEVQSILFAPFPYGPDELLVVLSDQATFVPLIQGRIMALDPPDVRVTCHRHRELFELTMPGLVNPIMTDTYAISAFWLRYTSEVLYGEDVREAIPVRAWTRQDAARPIIVAMDVGRQNLVLMPVVNRNYEQLGYSITAIVVLSMLAALLTRGEWWVEPESIVNRFRDAFPSIRETIDRLDEALEPDVFGDEEAYHLVFIFDSFLRRMLKEMYL